MDTFEQPPLTDSASPAGSTHQPALDLEQLLAKIAPLVQSGRLDNLVDILSLVSDAVDMLDPAMVEKLALLFEQLTSVSWSLGNAVRMASAQTAADSQAPTFSQLLSLLRHEDTRRGCAVALRTLNVIGRQL